MKPRICRLVPFNFEQAQSSVGMVIRPDGRLERFVLIMALPDSPLMVCELATRN